MVVVSGKLAIFNGICVTTSEFTNQAKELAADPEFNFFLIDKFNLKICLEDPFTLKRDLESFYS